MFRDGIRERSHYCTGVYLEKYVHSGDLEDEWTIMFDRMRGARHTDQYSFQIYPTHEEVESSIHEAERFIARIEKLLKDTKMGQK